MYPKSTIRAAFSIGTFAALALATVVGWYVYNFGITPSTAKGDWGQFGDYLGGTLNPILSFLSLIAILLTFALQSKQLFLSNLQLALSKEELVASREELRKSAEAQQQTAEALRQQARFSALSAQISAVSAALGAIDQKLNRQQNGVRNSGVPSALAILDPSNSQGRRNNLEAKLEALIKEAESA